MRDEGANPDRLKLGAILITASGAGIIVYGIVFIIRNFTGFIEPGLTHEHVGATAQQVQAFSPRFFNYVSHLQVAIGGVMVGLGLAVAALGWFGVRTGQRWAACGQRGSLYGSKRSNSFFTTA